MNNTKYPVLVPEYMRGFSCIGSACEDTCCAGWSVTIDRATYKKYNKSRDPELKPLLDKHIKRNRSNPTDNNYAFIDMCHDGMCPMLTEEKLCKIQLELGSEDLSNTCTTYPRIINRVNGVFEISSVMSCPEAARLALLHPEGIKFQQMEELYAIREINYSLDTTINSDLNSVETYFWDLRIFTIRVLQNRDLRLPERLFALGMFYQKIQQYAETNQLQLIPSLITSYLEQISDGVMKDFLAQMPENLSVQLQLLQQILDGKTSTVITNERYMQCLEQFLAGIEYDPDETMDDTVERFKKVHLDFYLPFMDQHEYILENYLVNYTFKSLFPLSIENSIFEEYVLFVLHYALIKMHLVGMSGFHKGLTLELVLKLIQSFSKQFEHSPYLKEVLNLLREDGYTKLSYMTILIQY